MHIHTYTHRHTYTYIAMHTCVHTYIHLLKNNKTKHISTRLEHNHKVLDDKSNETGINNSNCRNKNTCHLPNSCQTK